MLTLFTRSGYGFTHTRSVWLLRAAAVTVAVLALGATMHAAHASSSAYCSDVVQPANVVATATGPGSIGVSWVEQQSTAYKMVEDQVRLIL